MILYRRISCSTKTQKSGPTLKTLENVAQFPHDHYFLAGETGCAGPESAHPEKITLVVDGTRFVVDPGLFTSRPDTMLGRWFTSGFDFPTNSRQVAALCLTNQTKERIFNVFFFFILFLICRGEYELRDGTSASVFTAVLEYYRSGVIHCPPHVSVRQLCLNQLNLLLCHNN